MKNTQVDFVIRLKSGREVTIAKINVQAPISAPWRK
jgi:hypothetical protein